MTESFSYAAYLRLDRLLSCQDPPAPAGGSRPLAHHDELLFIVVHQVFELWFKEILHDLGRARDLLARPGEPPERRRVPEEDVPRAAELVARVNEILRLLEDQFTVLETMPPAHFLAFRDLLGPASGFQSVQFRELEILAGLDEETRVPRIGRDYGRLLAEAERARLERRRRETTLAEAVRAWLARAPVAECFPDFERSYVEAYRRYAAEQARYHGRNPNLAPAEAKAAAARIEAEAARLEAWLAPGDDEERRARLGFLFVCSYRDLPLLRWPSRLLGLLVEFEQRLRILRYRHARMVERMIGARTGTGGSPGVAYLDETALHYRIFGCLLEGHAYLLDPARLPDVPRAELLDFRFTAPSGGDGDA